MLKELQQFTALTSKRCKVVYHRCKPARSKDLHRTASVEKKIDHLTILLRLKFISYGQP